MWTTWIRGLKRAVRIGIVRQSAEGKRRRRPRLETLESRWALAYDLTIDGGPTTGVSYDGAGHFVANSLGAMIGVADLRAALLTDNNVSISNGPAGAQSGSIQWQAGYPLDLNGLGVGRSLMIVADPTTQSTASFEVQSSIGDSDPSTVDSLNVAFQARHDLTLDAPLASNAGSIFLRADSAQSGVGTLHATSSAVISSSATGPDAIRLQAADIDLQPGSAVRNNTPQVLAGTPSPSFLAYDSAGNLFVSSFYGNTVNKVAPNGTVTTFVSSGLANPEGVAFDADGNLYVANAGSGSISKIAPDGTASLFVASGLSAPSGLAFDASGVLYVANAGSNSIAKVSSSGVVTTFVATGLSQPDGLAFDATGNLYVANYGGLTISKISPSGGVSTFFSSPELRAPTGLAFGPDGSLYVADQGLCTYGPCKYQFAIYRVEPTGEGRILLPAGLVSDPQGLAFDAAGTLIVADRNNSRILAVSDQDGTISIHSSLFSRPMNLGGGDAAVSGINLTDAELSSLATGPGGSITFGDTTQAADIVFTTAVFDGTSKSIAAIQDTAANGAVVLDDFAGGTSNNEPAIARYNGGELRFVAGTGGVVRATSNVAIRSDIVLGKSGTLSVDTAGSFGSLAAPIDGVIPMLDPGAIGGDLRLLNHGTLATAGAIHVGGNFDVAIAAGDFRTAAGHLDVGSSTLTFRGTTGTQQLVTGGQPLTTVVHQGVATLAVADSLSLQDDFTQLSDAGPVDIVGRTVTIGGDWNWNGGAPLASRLSTVVLNGTNQTVQGSNEFHNFTKTTTVADTLTFTASGLQKFDGVLTLQGAPNQRLSLRSTTPGVQALINPLGYRAVSYVDVRDNFNIDASPLVATNSQDSGNTTNWQTIGAPAKVLALSGSSLNAFVGGTYGSLPVLVTDADGKPVSGVAVTFAVLPGTNGAGGTFTGNATAQTNANGIAFSPPFAANHTAGRFLATAAISGDVPTVTFTLTNLPGAAAQFVVLGGSPQTATIGTTYATWFQVQVLDAYGNAVPNVTVAFSAPNRGASGKFLARTTVATDALGVATAPAFRANMTRGSFFVTATVNGLPAVRFELTNVYVRSRRGR